MDLKKLSTQAKGMIGKLTDVVNTPQIENGINSALNIVKKNKTPETKENEDTDVIVTKEEQEKEGNKMLQVMDWAFEKANGNIPGFGTSQEMAKRYLEKYGSVNKAIDKLINWQITSAATAGFVTNLGGLMTMPITLPANVAGVMAIQLRMIGAIAELGGYHENTEEKKTGMYLCLLGSQAGDVLSKTASQFAIKFATASLKKIPSAVLSKINQQVGFRLLTKFGQKGLVNIHKAIPVLGGMVGGAIDAFSTYAIAKAAKALFLDEIIEFEKQEELEVCKIHLLINLAQLNSTYEQDEKMLIKTIVEGLNISPKVKKTLLHDTENPKKFQVDMTSFKSDLVLSSSTLHALAQVASIGGTAPIEQIYIRQLAKEMEVQDEVVNVILASTI